MAFLRSLRFAFVGAAAGLLVSGCLTGVWPIILPAVVRVEHYYGFGPELVQLLAMNAAAAVLPAALGGWLGSRIPREGGRAEQAAMAGLVGAAFAVPFACFSLWVWTGY